MKVGIMLMSNKGPDGQIWDWRKHLENCKRHGVEMVDLFDTMLQNVGVSILSAKKILGDLGLSAGAYGVGTDLVSPEAKARQQSLDVIKHGIEACHELGTKHLFSHGGQHNNSGEEALTRYIDGLSQAADIAAKEGIILSIENAGRMCHTDTELLKCVELVDRPNMKITFDGGNFILAGCDPNKAAELLGPKVVHVHVKSFIPSPDKSERLFKYCPIGQGLVDYRKIRDTLAAAGFDGCMSFEPEGGEDSKWYQSLDVLTQIVNEN